MITRKAMCLYEMTDKLVETHQQMCGVHINTGVPWYGGGVVVATYRYGVVKNPHTRNQCCGGGGFKPVSNQYPLADIRAFKPLVQIDTVFPLNVLAGCCIQIL